MNDGSVHLPDQTLHKSRGTETVSAGHPAGGVGDLGVEGVGDALFHVFILYLFIHTRQSMAASAEHLFRGEAGHAAAVEGADLKKAGAAGNLVAGDSDRIAQGAGPSGFGGAEDGHAGSAKEGG